MIQSRSRFGAILLAIAAIITCLALLSTTSSAAQTRTEARAGGAVAVAGGNDCLNSNDNNTGIGTGQDTGTNSGQNSTPDMSQDTTTSPSTNTSPSSTTSNPSNTTTGTNTTTSPSTTSSPDPNASQDMGATGMDTGNGTNQYTGTDNGGANTTSPDTGNNGNNAGNECVLANTVPDQSLPPTGAPVKSGTNETTVEKKTDPGKKPEASSETQKNSDSGKKQESNSEQQKKPSNGKKLEIQERGKKIEIQDRSGTVSPQEKPKSSSKAAPGSSKAASSSSETASSNSETAPKKDLAPVLATKWTRPSREEVASTDKPRRFAAAPGSEMTMSVRALGLYNAPVASSNRPEELDNGLVREPKTSLPWDKGDQRNVYVAGHYLGYPDTPSRLVFYNLHKLEKNDEIILKDSLGQSYKYRVSEKFAAGPEDSWAMGQVKGRDMLTLQTCIPPDFGKRLIVRADRV